MTQTHENAPSDRDHANVRFFPPLAFGAPMAAGLAMYFAFSDRFPPQGWVQLAAGPPLMVASGLLAVWASDAHPVPLDLTRGPPMVSCTLP